MPYLLHLVSNTVFILNVWMEYQPLILDMDQSMLWMPTSTHDSVTAASEFSSSASHDESFPGEDYEISAPQYSLQGMRNLEQKQFSN